MFLLGLISADQPLCRAISEQVKDASAWQLATFTSLEEALAVWSQRLPPIVIWDAQASPATDEMIAYFASVLDQARPAPFLLLLGASPDGLASFGVTESFARPLRLGYLIARLQFYQRILGQAPDVTLTLGAWSFIPRSHALVPRAGGDLLKLTEKESALLEFLYAATTPVPRDELLAAVWGYDARMDTHTLETHVYRLRKKIMPADGSGPDLFLVMDGGYQIHPEWRGA